MHVPLQSAIGKKGQDECLFDEWRWLGLSLFWRRRSRRRRKKHLLVHCLGCAHTCIPLLLSFHYAHGVNPHMFVCVFAKHGHNVFVFVRV